MEQKYTRRVLIIMAIILVCLVGSSGIFAAKVVRENNASTKKSIMTEASSPKQIVKQTAASKPIRQVKVSDLTVNAISVSCLKVSWTAEAERDYALEVITGAPFEENIEVVEKEDGLYYLTGLRENSEYEVTVVPVLSEDEDKNGVLVAPATVTGRTSQVIREKQYEYEDGWTNCFAGERASGLVAYPSYDAIVDTVVDPVTDTGIRRNEYGDYCCAMGLWYGEVGDRFLVELENGIQFTVMICDSKGMADDANGDGKPDGRFHWYGKRGERGKCIVEFIYEAEYMPDKVFNSGSWGYYNWSGLDLTANIKSIHKISVGTETITY